MVELAQEACEQHAIDIADPSSLNLQNQVQVGEEANENNTEPEEANPDNSQEKGTSDHYSEANPHEDRVDDPARTDPMNPDQQDHSEDPAERRRSECTKFILILVAAIFVQLCASHIAGVLYKITTSMFLGAFLCCYFTTVPLFTPWQRHFVYGSIVLLMCAGFTSVLQLNWLYVFPAAPFLILALAIVGFLYYKGFFGTVDTNDSQFDFDLYRAGNFNVIAFGGLVGTEVGYFKNYPHQKSMEIKLAEFLLFLSILAGLIVLPYTTFKPVFHNEGKVEHAVTTVLNYLPRILYLLLALVGFAAAAEDLRWYVVFLGLLIITAFWIVLEFFLGGPTTNQASTASAAAASPREVVAMAITAGIFSLLMGVHANVNGSGNYGSGGLRISCFLLLFAASFITLTEMHLMRAAARWARTATKILSLIGPLVVVAAPIDWAVLMTTRATNNGAQAGTPSPAPYHR